MRIESNLSNNFFALFDESLSIAKNKRRILKKNKVNKLSYFQFVLLVYIILVILSFIIMFTNLYYLSFIPMFIATIYLVLSLVRVYIIYSNKKEDNFISSVIMNKNGITDESYYGIKMIFNWNKIKAIVIKKYAITILTDTPVYFVFDKSVKDDIIKIVNKYNKDISIIEE